MKGILKGSRVRISGSNIKWAEGKEGSIEDISQHAFNIPGIPELRITVLLDDIDKDIPPYGLVTVSPDEIEYLEEENDLNIKDDPVNHPSHYTDGKYEVIDFIESSGFSNNFCIANAIKYLSRAGKKNRSTKQEDIEKAIWYLERYLKERRALDVKDIPVDDYVREKGLENTPQGVALALIANGNADLAIKVLKIKDI